MPRYVAFLRAVNVSGRFVKMAELRAALAERGWTEVESHIQSGNIRVGSQLRSAERVAERLRADLSDWAGFDIPAIVRTPAQVRDLLSCVDGIPALLPGESRRYLAVADRTIGAEATLTLDRWDKPGERARVLGADILAELTVAFHQSTMTNTRIERITGATTTWRDLKVIRAIDERWGPA